MPTFERDNLPAIEALSSLVAEIRSELSDFPRGCCEYTAALVQEVFCYPKHSGLFIDDSGVGHPHAWNVDPETGKTIDLTATQFNPALRMVYVAEPEGDEGSRHYLEDVGFGF